ncbi:MAG: thiol reductase thioredoxin [Proteobacteria bacterium]|nr:thiol reductase thioredoxin [Pseudomonadota bacterium]
MEDGTWVVCPRCTTRNVVPMARLPDRPRCGRCGKPLLGGSPAVLTADNWKAHLEASSLPTVVWLCAPWSEACAALAPDLGEAAEVLAEECRVSVLDVESEPQVAARLEVRAVPGAVLFVGGREVARRVGPIPVEELIHWVRDRVAGR